MGGREGREERGIEGAEERRKGVQHTIKLSWKLGSFTIVPFFKKVLLSKIIKFNNGAKR